MLFVQFRTLGALEVWDDGRALRLGPGRQRAFLSLLLLHPNEVVSTDRLVEDFWGEQAPASASKVIQGYVSRLRRELLGAAIETHGSGYLLHVGDTDVAEFERLLVAARSAEPAEAARTLGDALELWRGRPYADVEYEPWAQSEIGRLEELRLVALEERIEAELALGEHAAVVAELEGLVVEHPLRERLRRSLMLALYRSGRHAEALDVYRATRSALVEELGIEPSRDLQELEQQILAQDPVLDGPVPKRTVQPALRRRQRLDATLLAAGGLILAAAVGAGAYKLNEHRPSVVAVPNSVAAIDAKANRVLSFTSIGNTPTSVAFGAGSVWAVSSDQHTVSRIDPRTGKVERTIPSVVPPSNIAFGAGRLLVAGSANVLESMDPSNLLTVTTTRLPGTRNPLVLGSPSWVAAAAGAVWATSAGAVWRIAPAPRRRTLLVETGCCGPIAVGLGSVWVADDLGVIRLDARTGNLVRMINLPFHPTRIAVGLGGVWVTDGEANSVWRIDPNLNAVSGTTSVGQQPSGVAIGAGSVWVASAGGTVSRIDPRTTKVTDIVRVGGTPSDLAYGAGRVWVSVD